VRARDGTGIALRYGRCGCSSSQRYDWQMPRSIYWTPRRRKVLGRSEKASGQGGGTRRNSHHQDQLSFPINWATSILMEIEWQNLSRSVRPLARRLPTCQATPTASARLAAARACVASRYHFLNFSI
jgi:hypothetical protein